MSPTDQRTIGTDRINSLLASSRRRCVLSVLAENERLTVEKLGRKVAANERNGTGGGGSDDAADRVQVTLVHNHLPRLADHDVVDYDRERGEVAVGGSFDEVDSYLERLHLETDATPATIC